MRTSLLLRLSLPALAALLGGCGGGVPLLHPAHALAPGRTAFAVGVSDRFVLAEQQEALDYALARPPDSQPNLEDPRYARGVLVALAEGPAVSPFASARVGIAGSNEAGLSYSGQALRGDARHAFVWDKSAISAGLGVTGRGFGQSAFDPPGTELGKANGYGFDLPLLYGYRTDADLVSVWAGARASFDHWSGRVSLDRNEQFALAASRWAAGPILGLALGLPPFWIAAEVEVDYTHVTGSLDRPGARYDAAVDGWSVRPAGALTAKF